MKLSFVVSTQLDKGRTVGPVANVNSHIATYTHARARLLRPTGRVNANHGKAKHRIQPGSCQKSQRAHQQQIDSQDSKVTESEEPPDPRCLDELVPDFGGPLVNGDGIHTDQTSLIRHGQEPLSLYNGQGFDEQLSSCLDPFLQLPVKISRREKNLLHFQLTEGSRNLLGSSTNDAHCLTLQWAKVLMPQCQPFVYGMVLITEYIISKIRGTPIPDKFYLRRAQTYRAINDTLEDDEATILDKVVGLLSISILEQILGYPELHKKHAQALNMHIEVSGGVSEFVLANRKQRNMLESWVYFTNGKYAEVEVQTLDTLDSTVKRFTACLEKLGKWASSLRSSCHNGGNSPQRDHSFQIGNALLEYVDWLLNFNLTDPNTDFALMSGSFHYIFTLCLTPTMQNYNTSQTKHFLEHVDSVMAASYIIPPGKTVAIHRVDPFMVLQWLQTNSNALSADEEIFICQSTWDMLKILPLLSPSKRLQLAHDLASCAFAIASPVGVRPFSDEYLSDLMLHVTQNWIMQQLGCLQDGRVTDGDGDGDGDREGEGSEVIPRKYLDRLHEAALASSMKDDRDAF